MFRETYTYVRGHYISPYNSIVTESGALKYSIIVINDHGTLST